jgi:predicted house-cleaning noncanonical NTP pyrophosphatase (MazG superfamily)
MRKKYNKLVRDNIPQMIMADHKQPVTRYLSDSEYRTALEKKLLEEYDEFLETTNSSERVEELADMMEIIRYLAKLEGKTHDEIVFIADEKLKKNGGFDKKIFLKGVVIKDE